MDYRPQESVAGRSTAVDQGLRSYMLNIYNLMGSALVLTGVVALFAVQSEALMSLLYQIQMVEGEMYLTGMNTLGWVVAFSPLVAILIMSFGMNKLSTMQLQLCFWGFAVLMGLSMSNIFLMYTGTSVARVFFIAAGMFGGMSLYGYTTKRDMSGMGGFLMMGVIGLIIASVVNMFLASSALQFGISVLGVLIFAGLTAHDTQKLKRMYHQVASNSDAMARASIMGALTLYLDFINMFIFLLQLVGDRR